MIQNDVCVKKDNETAPLLDEALFPDTEEIFGWIRDLTQWGHRKTGTPEGRKSAEYIADKFREFGMEEVEIETVPSLCMFSSDYALQIDGTDYETFYVNATNRQTECGVFRFGFDGKEQEFVFLGDGWEADFADADVNGRIVVCSIRFGSSRPRDMMSWFKKYDVYDPDDLMSQESGEKPDIYSPNNWPGNYCRAMQGGAAGFVGILEDYMDDPYFYCEDYGEVDPHFTDPYVRIPALWVSRSSGKRIKEAFASKGVLNGHMQICTEYKFCNALNVKGILPGKSDDIILVHSHHDAVFDGAVQDGSGISEMLAVGKYFSGLDRSQREKTMMFAATDTHYTDYRGHKGFIKKRREVQDHIILDLAIEHIGKEVVLDENGEMIETGEAESRMVYVTEGTGLYDFIRKTFAKYDIVKTIFAPVRRYTEVPEGIDFSQDEVISDAAEFSQHGYPVVSTVAGEVYLYHPSDRLDRVAKDLLVPIGKAFTEIALQAAFTLGNENN